MRIYVSGSLAYDRIMDFPDRFSNHILPDKIHMLNVCFVVNGVEEKFGGTAGNIAYSLALLGENPMVLGSAGKDFANYEAWMRKNGLTLDGIRRIDDEFTAGAYITTDKADNQITGFNPGAMKHPCLKPLDKSNIGGSLLIVSPGNVQDMNDYPASCRELNIPYIYDPGQQITVLSGEQLTNAITGAKFLITNDYELELIMKATELTLDDILTRAEYVITTLGEHGARVHQAGAKDMDIPAAKVNDTVDPTGAGDSFRAGLIKGLTEKRSLDVACRMGAVTAAYCVECYGTQEHAFTNDEFWARYKENFGEPA